MQRKQVDYKSVLSLFLPQGILDYFGSVIILGDLTICHKSVSLRHAT